MVVERLLALGYSMLDGKPSKRHDSLHVADVIVTTTTGAHMSVDLAAGKTGLARRDAVGRGSAKLGG